MNQLHSKTPAALTAFVGLLSIATLAFPQNAVSREPADAKNDGTSKTIVTVDGVTCRSNTSGVFEVSSFHLGVTTVPATSGGGGGAPKPTFNDLVLQKPFDSCSPRLLLMATTGQHAKKLTLTSMDKNNKPVVTMLLEDVQITNFQLQGVDSAASPLETLNFDYFRLTVSDGQGNTTGPIVH